jgi:hypothetical protein
MKKYLGFLIGTGLLIATLSSAVLGNPNPEKIHSRQGIHRTAVVIIAAQNAARTEHRYAGLARAVAHQRYARRLYQEGLYVRAIHQSLRARRLVIVVLKFNRAETVEEAAYNRIEAGYMTNSPPDNNLDQEMAGETIGKDEEAVSVHIDLDID